MKIDTNNPVFNYHLSHQGDNFQLTQLLASFGIKSKLIGSTRVKVNLRAKGNSPLSIKNSLEGELVMEISNGEFHGTDLIHTLKEAKSIKIVAGLKSFPEELYTLVDTLEALDLTDND